METKYIKLKNIKANSGQIEGLPKNPRCIRDDKYRKLKASIEENPEMLELRELLVYPHGEDYIIIGGNMRFRVCQELGYKELPCKVIPESATVEQLKAYTIKDNSGFGEWDWDALANEWDSVKLEEWGLDFPVMPEVSDITPPLTEEEEIERKKKEFEERMAAGEISEEDEEYQAFLSKFELKKTTDDCYTPEVVYDAVADWVANEYNLNRSNFVRPFYPGGDYQKEKYKATDIVVDNPPFSILSEILKYYTERGIRFFLFAPTLTLFSSSSSSSSTALPLSAPITYANGANVNTSFLTNLEDEHVRARSCPSLYQAVDEANAKNLASMRKELPKYAYDHHIVTSPFIGQLSRLGIDFVVPVSESAPISQLECQKSSGKAIFGNGYIVSDRVFAEREKAEREKAEREKAEREKAEREKAERWELGPKELAIVAKLNAKQGTRS